MILEVETKEGFMELITFQPAFVRDTILAHGMYLPKHRVAGDFDKVFCLAVDEKTMERLPIVAPSFPQIGIIFETEDYEVIDAISWVNHLSFGDEYVCDQDCKYKEYTVPHINKSNVKQFVEISSSSDADAIQDDFLECNIELLSKRSGKRWKSFDCLFKQGSPISVEAADSFLLTLMNCVMPQYGRRVTNSDYDHAIELINRYLVA